MKLLLDEMLKPEIAGQLRERGRDATAVVDDPLLLGALDRRVLEVAASEERAVVTYDIGDFIAVDEEWRGAGRTHAGMVLVSQGTFPQRGRQTTGRLVTALDRLASGEPPWPGFVDWLKPP